MKGENGRARVQGRVVKYEDCKGRTERRELRQSEGAMWKTRSGRRYSEDENANARFERRALGCVEIGKTIFGRWEFVDGVWTDLKGRAYLKTDIREVRCENRYVKGEIYKVSFARRDLEDKV